MKPSFTAAAALTALALSTSLASAAPSAEPLRTPTVVYGASRDGNADGACTYRTAKFRKWTPADGAPARFIAQVTMAADGNEWIGLGYDDRGYWAAEITTNDACDHCETLALSRTGFDGKRKVIPVTTFDGGMGDEKAILAKLFRIANAGEWDVTKLRHDATVQLAPRKPDGTVVNFPAGQTAGWMVEARKPGLFQLRFAEIEESSMCWCISHFSGYALAKPKTR